MSELIPYRILLVHNALELAPITWLSLIIRVFTFGRYNHVAVEVGSEYVVESIGSGVKVRNYATWERAHNRKVLPMYPNEGMTSDKLESLLNLLDTPYGFGDLLRIAWYFINQRWFGRTVKVRNGRGLICNEIGCLVLGIDWLIVPNEFQYLPGLIRGQEFETKKK